MELVADILLNTSNIYIFSFLVTILCIIVSYKLLLFIRDVSALRKYVNQIPGPKGYPIVGNVIELAKLTAEDQPKWLCDQSLRHKDGLSKVWTFWKPHVIVSSPRHLERILSSTVNLDKSEYYDPLREWLSTGLFTSDGKRWVHDRKLLNPTFCYNILNQFIPIKHKHCNTLVERIDQKLKANPGKPIDVNHLIGNCSLDLICGNQSKNICL